MKYIIKLTETISIQQHMNNKRLIMIPKDQIWVRLTDWFETLADFEL